MDTERHWGTGQGTGCAGRPLTGLPALRTLLSWGVSPRLCPVVGTVPRDL